jgi:hypothetical protein
MGQHDEEEEQQVGFVVGPLIRSIQVTAVPPLSFNAARRPERKRHGLYAGR